MRQSEGGTLSEATSERLMLWRGCIVTGESACELCLLKVGALERIHCLMSEEVVHLGAFATEGETMVLKFRIVGGDGVVTIAGELLNVAASDLDV